MQKTRVGCVAVLLALASPMACPVAHADESSDLLKSKHLTAVGNLYWSQPLLDFIARDLRTGAGAAGWLVTATSQARQAWEHQRHLGPLPICGPDVCIASTILPDHGDQRPGHPWLNEPAYGGQWRQAAWALVSQRRYHDRLPALAHAALRRRDLLRRCTFAPSRTRMHLRPTGGAGPGIRTCPLRSGRTGTSADISVLYSQDTKLSLNEFPPLRPPPEGRRRQQSQGNCPPNWR